MPLFLAQLKFCFDCSNTVEMMIIPSPNDKIYDENKCKRDSFMNVMFVCLG